MARSQLHIMRSLTVACVLGLGAMATLVGPLAPSVALAKSGGGNSGGGNSGGHGGGNAGGSSGSHGQSNSAAADSSKGTTKSTTASDAASDAASDSASSDVARKQAALAANRTHHTVSATKTNAVARELGNLNAVHASATARAHAAPNSMVGAISRYDTAMRQALSISDPVLRAAAINAARADLAAVANKPLTGLVVARVDRILGLRTGNL